MSDVPDDVTRVSRRRVAGDETEPARRARTTSDAAPPPRRRSTAVGPADPVQPSADDDGSTVVVRRESRRRAEAAAIDDGVELADTVLTRTGAPRDLSETRPATRASASPIASDTYSRREVPTVVESTENAAATGSCQEPIDTAALERERRRRATRRLVVAGAVAAVVAACALAALIALVLSG